MTDDARLSRFHDVDAAPDPAFFLKMLDAQDEVPGIIAARAEALRMLAPAPGHHLLDVGSGTGGVVRELARRAGSTGRVVGIDVSETMLAEATRRSEEAGPAGFAPHTFVQGDAQSLRFDDASFDGARSERTFQHLADPEIALREMIRVVKPGSRIVVLDTDWDSFSVDLGDLALERRFIHAGADRWPSGTVGRRLQGMFERAGVRDVEVAPVGVALGAGSFAAFPIHPAIMSAQEAVRNGRLTDDEGRRVIEAVERGGGRSFAIVMMFAVGGTTP